MRKKLMMTIPIVLITFSIGLVSYYLISQSVNGSEKGSNEQPQVSEVEDAGEKEINEEEIDTPFSKYITKETADDEFMQTHIHWMSHQKVDASDKWGFELLTDKRIEWLLKALDKTKLKHEDVYRDILERWKDGDFTQVDTDHNEIWELQGGSIGEATKSLTPGEEQELLEEMEYKDCYDCKETGSEEGVE